MSDATNGDVQITISSLQVLTPGPSPHYRRGNPEAIAAVKLLAEAQGFTTDVRFEPRRIDWLPSDGAEFEHQPKPEDRTAHHIPPEGAQEVFEWLTIAGGGAVAMAVFIRNALGALIDWENLGKQDLTFELTYRGRTLTVKPGEDVEPRLRALDQQIAEELSRCV